MSYADEQSQCVYPRQAIQNVLMPSTDEQSQCSYPQQASEPSCTNALQSQCAYLQQASQHVLTPSTDGQCQCAYTVCKMGLILCSIERMLKMQFSTARNFTLQPLRSYDVKPAEKTAYA